MTSRIRSIKPEAFLDEKLWDAEMEHPDLHLFRAFTGLWCQADREGRFEWRPRALKAAILPYWEGDFGASMDALETHGFIDSYEVAGRRYGEVRNFHKHQFPNAREAHSRLPGREHATHVHAHATHVHAHALHDLSRARTGQETLNSSDTTADSLSKDADALDVTCMHVHALTASIPSLSLPFPIPPPGGAGGGGGGEPQTESRAQAWVRDPNRTGLEHGTPDTWPEVRDAFDDFSAVWGVGSNGASKLRGARDPRVTRIVERYAEGFTRDQLREAAEGAKRDTFVQAKPELQTIATIWRDAGQVEKFRRLLEVESKPRVLRDTNVQKVWDAFRVAHQLGDGALFSDEDAAVLANAIRDSSIENCVKVALASKTDDIVTGVADAHGLAHRSVQYVFGNTSAFNRILLAATEQDRRAQKPSADEQYRRMMNAKSPATLAGEAARAALSKQAAEPEQ